MLRAVIFDLWGTLIDDDAESNEVRRLERVAMASSALAGLGMPYDEAHIEQAFHAAGRELSRVHSEGLDLSTEGRTVLYLRHIDDALPDRLDDAGWRTMHEAVLTAARRHPPALLPDSRAGLDAVRELGLSCGLISNAGITPGFVLREVLDGYGLLDALDHPIFSDEVELAKPTTEIFEQALERFGIDPHEAAFVGDQPVLDVLGPMSAGLWSVQVGDIAQEGIEPHARVASVAGVVPALRSLGLL